LFAYLSYPTAGASQPLPAKWSLGSFMPSDVLELERFYKKVSGGLLLNVLRLDKEDGSTESLTQLYAKH